MGFFDNLGKKASAAYDATAERTGRIAKEAKLKMKINENKSDIKDLYIEIGKKVYEKHVREENIDINTELEEECTKIDVLSAEIETCLKSILELKEKKQCTKCHSEIELEFAYCPICGEKQPGDNLKEDKSADENSSEESELKEENTSENSIEKMTEIMAVETQQNAIQEMKIEEEETIQENSENEQ